MVDQELNTGKLKLPGTTASKAKGIVAAGTTPIIEQTQMLQISRKS